MNAVDHDILALQVAIKAIRDGLYEIAEAEARVRCLQISAETTGEEIDQILEAQRALAYPKLVAALKGKVDGLKTRGVA